MSTLFRFTSCFFTLITIFTTSISKSFQNDYYDGNIIIDTIDVEIFINLEAEVIAEYTLINTSDAEEAVEIEFIRPSITLYIDGEPINNPITFSPKEQKKIIFNYIDEIEGETVKSISFSPQILINEKRIAKPTHNYLIKLLLPKGIPSLIGSSETYTNKILTNEGRSLYQWEFHNLYPTTIYFLWNNLGVNFEVNKFSTQQDITEPNQIITIQITLKNIGDDEFQHISLIDNFDPSEFKAIQPSEEFTTTSEKNSDPRLIWRKDVEKIGPQEVLSFEYSVQYTGDTSTIHDFKIEPVNVFIDDKLAAISNTVTLRKMVKATRVGIIKEEIEEKPDFLKIGLITAFAITFVVVLVALALMIRNAKKKSH